MDFFARGRRGLDGGVNQFQLLHNDALDFKEVVFIGRGKFFCAGDGDEMVELFPAFDVGLDLRDQLIDILGRHKRRALGVGIKAVCGNKKMMAPPRNSRAVMRRLPKYRFTSASGMCAARASRNSSSTSCPMPCNIFWGKAEDTVEVTTLPCRSTVTEPVGSCWILAGSPNILRNIFFKSPMTQSVFDFFLANFHWRLTASRSGTRGPRGQIRAPDVPSFDRRHAGAAPLQAVHPAGERCHWLVVSNVSAKQRFA